MEPERLIKGYLVILDLKWFPIVLPDLINFSVCLHYLIYLNLDHIPKSSQVFILGLKWLIIAIIL